MLYIIGAIFVSICFVVFFGSPYVPTLRRDVNEVMKIYPLSTKDVFVDAGSGDGVMLRRASRVGARAIGYELSPWLYVVSKLLCLRHKNISIHLANFWRVTLPEETTVVYTFLNGRHINKLARKLEKHVQRTGRTLYFISYGFKPSGLALLKERGPVYLYKMKPESQESSPSQTITPRSQ